MIDAVIIILVSVIVGVLYSSLTMIAIRKEEERNKAMYRLIKTVIKTVEEIDTTVDSLVELQQKLELRKKYPMPIEMEEITDGKDI